MSRTVAVLIGAIFILLSPASRALSAPPRHIQAIPAGTTILNEPFTGSATTNAWTITTGACLTAGNSTTPTASIPACGSNAPVDPVGSGALQITGNTTTNPGARAIATSAFSTAQGLQVIFTDAAFNSTTTIGADGLSMFFLDASQPMPTIYAGYGGSLAYLALPGGYLGVGFDEYGNFSSIDGRGTVGTGYPGRVPETVAIRGSSALSNPYLGGYTGTTSTAQSLPFHLDSPTLTTRPAAPPTIRVTLSATGMLTVEIDPHDGNGYRTTYNAVVVGVNGQPALPANVYIGFGAGTGGIAQRHQIENLTVTTIGTTSPTPTPTPSPTPSPTPTAGSTNGFVPTQIPNLAAWYDASNAASIVQTANAVSAWNDRSGNGNTLSQASTASMPTTGSNIDGVNALNFSGSQFITSNNASFSQNLINASTVFVVTNATSTTVDGSVLSAGIPPFGANPRWELRPFEQGATHFDFNNKSSGRLSATENYVGPAFWTAAGSIGSEYLRKDGNTIASSTGPTTNETATYPLIVGGNLTATGGQLYPYYGSVGEILIYHRFLTTAESQSVEGYLACKWGMQNRLPENHPYRATCPGASTTGPAPIPTATPKSTSNAIPIIPELRSANGSLALTVTAVQDASGNPHLSYNGSYTAPTLRLLPGDTLKVTLVNNLPTPGASAGYVNDTNLHFHGLHVSPNAPADDSIDMLALPGQTLNYSIPIPANHPTGLYWYHSHAHGEVERQNLSGMSGALIIDGVAQYAPAVANMPERVLVARDTILAGQVLPAADRRQLAAMGWAMSHNAHHYGQPMNISGPHATMTMGDGAAVRSKSSIESRNPFVLVDPNYKRFDRHRYTTADGHCVGTETAAKGWTLNGVTNPSIGIRPGEQQFWRLVNAGSDTYLDVAVDNAQLQIVSIDGVPIGSGINTPTMLAVNDYVLPPASRVEFVVTGPAAGTTAYLRTKCFDAGTAGPAMPATTLAAIDPTTSLSDYAHKRQWQRVAPHAHAYVFPRTASRFVGVAPGKAGARRMYATGPIARTQTLFYSDQNTINGVAYDPGAAPQFYAQSGTFEEWTIVNNSAQVHTFHIHQIHFVVEAINGITQSQEYVMDNVNVPAASTSGPGSVKILLDFTDPLIVGTFLLHCHILSHEDGGMMAKIRIGTAPPLTVSNGTLTFANATSVAQAVTIGGGKAPYAISGCANVATGTINGTTVSVKPTGGGSCVFTISDSTGLTATVAVNVGAAAATVIVSPNSLSFTSPSAASQNATVSGGTAPYSVSGCTGIANAAINGTQNGVAVAPVAAGSCSLTIKDSNANAATLAVSVNAISSGGPLDNITFHHDVGRTGWYQNESSLNTTNVASTNFKMLGTITAPSGMTAFGKVYAQPLYIQNEATSDGKTHNLVIVATSTDQVYAFDETTQTVVWNHNFTNPGGGITQQLWTDTGCGDINPNVGIVGTPVIDRSLDRLFVVVPTKENGVFHTRLHAISLSSGADAVSPVEVSATLPLASGGTASTSPINNFNRGALLEANGNIYVPLSSHCDFQSQATHGWVLSFSNSTLAATGNALDSTQSNNGSNYFLGSVWMSGYGPAADASGNIYFATGNGPYDGTHDFSMSAIRVPGNLDITKASTFTPSGAVADSAADADLASGGVMLLPNVSGTYPHLMLVGGKCGVGTSKGGTQGCQKYLLNRDNLGGFTTTDSGALWHMDIGGGEWGGPAAFQDAAGNTYVVIGNGYPVYTLKLGLAPPALTVQASSYTGCLECRTSGSQPIVSSNGTTAGTAVAWALKTVTNSGGTLTLYAFDAINLNHVLYTGSIGPWTVSSGASYIGGAYISPVVANGRVYAPYEGGVAVFGLSQ